MKAIGSNIVNEGPAYLPPIEEVPELHTIDMRDQFGIEAALYVNQWNEVVAYYDVSYGCLREQTLMHLATIVLHLDWNINREYIRCNN